MSPHPTPPLQSWGGISWGAQSSIIQLWRGGTGGGGVEALRAVMPIWFELDHSLFAHFLLTPTAQGLCLKVIPIPVKFDRQGHAVSSSTGRKQFRFNFERGVKGNPSHSMHFVMAWIWQTTLTLISTYGNKLVVPARTPRIKVTDAYILNGTWDRGRDICKYLYYSEMRKGWHSDLTVTLQWPYSDLTVT